MIKKFLSVGVAVGLVSLLFAEAVPQKYVRAMPVVTDPRVDGALDDAVWKDVSWQTGYVKAKKGGEPTEQTRFKAVYTDDALYVAVESLDREPEKIHPEPNDAEWWYVDIAELFLGAGGDDILHLICTARGHRHEEIPGRIQLENAGKETWSAAAKVGKRSWTCEFKVPLAMIGVKPGDAYLTVPFNLCRCISRNREFSSWNFSPTTFRNAAGFGRLAFAGRNFPRPELKDSEITISCWAKTGLPDKNAAKGRTSYAFLSWGKLFRLMLGGNGKFESEFDASANGTNYQFITRADVKSDVVQLFEPNQWTHFAASYSLKEGATSLWVDGQHVGSRKDDLRHLTKLLPIEKPEAKFGLLVGSLPGGVFPVDGEIKGVKVYDHAVTAEELSRNEESVWKALEPAAKTLGDLKAARQARRVAEADRLFQGGRTLRYSIIDVLGRKLYKWDTPLEEETLDKPLKIVSAQGEFESNGFIIRSKEPIREFLPVVSELKRDDGQATLPANVLDLRIAKVMVRAVSAYSKVRVLKPTVLLHDDKLLRVDEENMENWMRFDYPSGSKYVNVSVPLEKTGGGQKARLKVEDYPIYDAKTLQPADIKDHRTIEYHVTSHVPADAEPGLYSGTIALKTTGGASYGAIPVELRVLPFALPEAKTRYDPNRAYERGTYHRVGDRFDTDPASKGTISQRGRNERQIRAEFRNMAEHGIQHPCICMGLPMPYWKGNPSCYRPTNGGEVYVPNAEETAYFKQYVGMMREEGLSTDPLYVFNNGNLGFRDHYDRKTMKAQLDDLNVKLRDYLMANLGHTNVLFYGVDEAQGDALTREFDFWEDAGKFGWRFYTTIMRQNIPRVAGRIHLASVSHAMDKASARELHDAGTLVWSYANPQSNLLSEPFPFRVNFGLGEWLSNWDGYGVYAYNESNYNPWNCWDGGEYSYVFQTADGVCDLLNWEGQREAYDDVRYATKLLECCRVRPDSSVAREALAWLDKVDPTHPAYDPNAVREKIVGYILKLLPADQPVAAPSLLPAGKRFKLVWHDEFNGTALDTAKWSYRTNFWGKRADWFARPEDGAVVVSNGCAHLKIVRRADGSFCSPQLQTGGLLWDDLKPANGSGVVWPFAPRETPKFLHRYGYYECRAKLQSHEGWWTAFWLQSPANGATLDPRRSGVECDIFESFKPGEHIVHAFHYNGCGKEYKRFNAQRAPYTPTPEGAFKLGFPIATNAFHTVGLLWESDGYTVFVDGRQSGYKVGRVGDEAVSQVEQFVLLTTELKGYRQGTGPDPEVAGAHAASDAFVVDFVRVYDIEE